VALPHVVQLLFKRQTSGILRVAAVDDVAEGLNAACRIADKRNCAQSFNVT
jgi:hypothetical protein